MYLWELITGISPGYLIFPWLILFFLFCVVLTTEPRVAMLYQWATYSKYQAEIWSQDFCQSPCCTQELIILLPTSASPMPAGISGLRPPYVACLSLYFSNLFMNQGFSWNPPFFYCPILNIWNCLYFLIKVIFFF